MLDWTTGLDFDLANSLIVDSLAIHHAAQYNNSLSRTPLRDYGHERALHMEILGGKHVHAVSS